MSSDRGGRTKSGTPVARCRPEEGLWSVALPLKRLAEAKSRMLLPPSSRAALALAMGLDTAEAALRCRIVGQVSVICADDKAASAFSRLGCRVVVDTHEGRLNAALADEARCARAARPTRGFASLMADLPAMASGELEAALSAAAGHGSAFVPDRVGSGTTLLAVMPGNPYRPSYGARSSTRHWLAGAVPLDVPASSGLRRDIDTLDDLFRASALPLGPRTTALLAKSRVGLAKPAAVGDAVP